MKIKCKFQIDFIYSSVIGTFSDIFLDSFAVLVIVISALFSNVCLNWGSKIWSSKHIHDNCTDFFHIGYWFPVTFVNIVTELSSFKIDVWMIHFSCKLAFWSFERIIISHIGYQYEFSSFMRTSTWSGKSNLPLSFLIV